MAIKTFVSEFAPYPFLYRTHFNPETDHYLTPDEQAGCSIATETDLTKAGFRVEYVGKVLGIFERNGYDDSDFCAYVELSPGKFGAVTWGSTRSWTYLNSAKVDATDDVYERFWVFRDAFWAKVAFDREANEVTVARVGKPVTVTGGRKYAGRTGKVGWIGETFHQWRMRVIPDEGEAFFVPLNFTDLPDHENTVDKVSGVFAENFRGAPQVRGSKVTAG